MTGPRPAHTYLAARRNDHFGRKPQGFSLSASQNGARGVASKAADGNAVVDRSPQGGHFNGKSAEQGEGRDQARNEPGSSKPSPAIPGPV